MTVENDSLQTSRRRFLKGAAIAGAAPALAATTVAEAQVATPRHLPSALPPTAHTIALETAEPAGSSAS